MRPLRQVMNTRTKRRQRQRHPAAGGHLGHVAGDEYRSMMTAGRTARPPASFGQRHCVAAHERAEDRGDEHGADHGRAVGAASASEEPKPSTNSDTARNTIQLTTGT